MRFDELNEGMKRNEMTQGMDKQTNEQRMNGFFGELPNHSNAHVCFGGGLPKYIFSRNGELGVEPRHPENSK